MIQLVGPSGPLHGLSRYAGALRWFARTLWEAFGWRVVGAVLTAQIGVAVVGAGLALSLTYLQELERDGTVRLGSRVALEARDETTLWLMVGLTLVVLLGGAGVLYLAQHRIIGMAVDLNHHVRMNIALAYGGQLPSAADWSSERSVWRALWQLQTRDARRTAIVARSLLRNTVNVGIAVGGLAALFYLEARMTLLFLGLMAVAMVSYYRANAATAAATRRYEAVAPSTRRGLHALLSSFQTSSQPDPARTELEAALDLDAVDEETASFRERFGAHIHAELLGFVIMGIALAGLMAFMGRDALAGELPWTRLVAYIVVLRLTLGGIRSLLSTFAFFSRFYPSIDRLNRFFAASSSTASDAPLAALPLRTGPATLTGSEAASAPVEVGETIEVVLPVPLSRYSLGLLAPAFTNGDPVQRRRLLGQTVLAARLAPPPMPASMRGLLLLDDDLTPEALRAGLGDQAEVVAATLGLDPGVVRPVEAWAELPRSALDRLVLLGAASSRRPVVAVDRRLLDAQQLERLAGDRDDRVVVVCSTGAPQEDDPLGIERVAVASTAGGVVAVGSRRWVAANWETIRVQTDVDVPAADADEEPLDDED